MKFIQSLFAPKAGHIWKETGRENLGEVTHFGCHPYDITHMYRIAVHETCLITGAKRIREVRDLFPAEDRTRP